MKHWTNFCALAAISLAVVSAAHASDLIVCQHELCSLTDSEITGVQYMEQIRNMLQDSVNGRIDFCEASAKTHLCQTNAIYWETESDANKFQMAIPNARISVIGNDVALDYVLEANNSYPRCMFSPVELSILADDQLRMISYVYNCNLLETEPTNIQHILDIDFIDLDHKVLGGNYLIQSGGAIEGEASGYAMIQIRDAQTALPLVGKRYRNLAPRIPIPVIAQEEFLETDEEEELIEVEEPVIEVPVEEIQETEETIEEVAEPEDVLPPEPEEPIAEPEPVVEPEPEPEPVAEPESVVQPEIDDAPKTSFWQKMGSAFDVIGDTAEKILYFEPLN